MLINKEILVLVNCKNVYIFNRCINITSLYRFEPAEV